METRTGALELEKPGRDPRSPIEEFRFADGVSTMEDLKPGMKIPAIITNVTNLEHLQMWE
ncbi:MAG: hypothetical protein ABIP79_17000 [Chitinophagaceae bacterium]